MALISLADSLPSSPADGRQIGYQKDECSKRHLAGETGPQCLQACPVEILGIFAPPPFWRLKWRSEDLWIAEIRISHLATAVHRVYHFFEYNITGSMLEK